MMNADETVRLNQDVRRWVGLEGFQHPIVVLDQAHQHQNTVASLSVRLPTDGFFSGTERTMIMDILGSVRGELTIRNLPDILRRLCRTFETDQARVVAEFPYFCHGSDSLSHAHRAQVYSVHFASTLQNGRISFTVSVTVPIRVYRGPQAVRGRVRVEVTSDAVVWIEDIVALVQDTDNALHADYDGCGDPPQEERFIDAVLQRSKESTGCRGILVSLICDENQGQCTTFANARWQKDQSVQVDRVDDVDSAQVISPQFSFGAWLKHQRLARQLSQSELAHRIGITPSFLSRMEGDERTPSREHLESIARIMGLDAEVVQLRAGVLPQALLNKIQRHPESYLG